MANSQHSGPHAAIPDFVPPSIMRDRAVRRALQQLHPHAQALAEVLRALITYGEWTTTSRVRLAQALAGWLEDIVEIDLHYSRGAPQATLRLRKGGYLVISTDEPGATSTGEG